MPATAPLAAPMIAPLVDFDVSFWPVYGSRVEHAARGQREGHCSRRQCVRDLSTHRRDSSLLLEAPKTSPGRPRMARRRPPTTCVGNICRRHESRCGASGAPLSAPPGKSGVTRLFQALDERFRAVGRAVRRPGAGREQARVRCSKRPDQQGKNQRAWVHFLLRLLTGIPSVDSSNKRAGLGLLAAAGRTQYRGPKGKSRRHPSRPRSRSRRRSGGACAGCKDPRRRRSGGRRRTLCAEDYLTLFRGAAPAL